MTGFLAVYIRSFVDIYGFVLVIYAFLSWFPEARYTSLGKWLENVTKPYLDLFRRFPLQLGPFDLTVFVAIVALQVGGRFLTEMLLAVL